MPNITTNHAITYTKEDETLLYIYITYYREETPK